MLKNNSNNRKLTYLKKQTCNDAKISQNVLEPKGRACDINWVFNWLLSRLSKVCMNCSCNSVKGECSTFNLKTKQYKT